MILFCNISHAKGYFKFNQCLFLCEEIRTCSDIRRHLSGNSSVTSFDYTGHTHIDMFKYIDHLKLWFLYPSYN